MSEANATPAPPRKEFRNIHVTQLVHYRLPLPGVVSILHRISGALLFLLLPFLFYLFEQSLTSELSFSSFQEVTSSWPVRLILAGLIWAYLHHFCAGIRHLINDLHIGLEKHQAGQSAVITLIVSLSLTVILVLKLFGAY